MTLADLASAALVGTERRPPAAPDLPPGPLADAVAGRDWAGAPEAALLQAAAVLDTHARAGVCAADLADAVPAPAPEETAPAVGAGACTLLTVLLTLPRGSGVLEEWLSRAARRGERVDPPQLPALLDLATEWRALRPLLHPAGGARLAWLAAHREDWAWAASADAVVPPHAEPDKAWPVSTVSARLALLADLRAADPDAARALVISSWEEDQPADRVRFLELLRDRLGPADEPLLERAVADRRKEVRVAAATLLTMLPGSAYAARVQAVLAPLVSLGGRLRRGLEITLPDQTDAQLRRELVRHSSTQDMGERAQLLRDLVAAAGLGFWTTHLGVEAEELVRLASRHDHETALIGGLRIAAIRERDPAWCAALAGDDDAEMLRVLVAADDELAASHLHRASFADAYRRGLDDIPGPWGPAFTARAVRLLGKTKEELLYRDLFTAVARAAHPSSLPAVHRLLQDVLRRHPEHVSAALDHLQHRTALIRELPLPEESTPT